MASLDGAETPALEFAAVSSVEGSTPSNPEARLARAEDTAQQTAKITAAEAWIDTKITALVVAKNARRRGSGDQLQDQLDRLRQAADGALDVNALAQSHLPPGADSAAAKKARNAIDAGFKRARSALKQCVFTALDTEGHADAELIAALVMRRTRLQ